MNERKAVEISTWNSAGKTRNEYNANDKNTNNKSHTSLTYNELIKDSEFEEMIIENKLALSNNVYS